MKPVAIVVCGFNGEDFSESCINSIYKHTKIPFHLIAVNNGSKDDTGKLFDSFQDKTENFTSIHLPKNLGFAGGYNAGIRWALKNLDFDHLMIINNDIIVTPHYLERMLKCLDTSGKVIRKKNIGLVGPMTNYVGGRQALSIPEIKTTEDINKFADTHYKANKGNYFECGRLIGFCILMKKEVLERAGLLDEDFFAMWEDNTFALQTRAAGFISTVAADTFIYHYGSKTINSLKSTSGKQLFDEGKKLFYDKWAKINKAGERKKLVGMMRVKNGEDCLSLTLEAASRMDDKIVVFDDHSTDATPEICKSFEKVIYIKSPFTTFDEARDRNFLLQEAKRLNPDWIFSHDHDEIPEERLIEQIQNLLNCDNPEKKAFIFRICHMWDSPKTVRMDGLWGGFWQCRLFKNEPNQEIVGDDEGFHAGSAPAIPVENMAYTFYRIKHYGNMDAAGRKRKYEWYTKTDTNKDVGMILGAWAPYYRELYYGDPKAELKDEDYYKHIVDDKGIRLVPWVERNTISACIVARDEEHYIGKLLENIKNYVDEIIVVVDTRSKDATKEMARLYTDKIYDFVWANGFSDIRNFAMSKATGNWILQLDADEIVPHEVFRMMDQAVQCTDVTAYLCSIKNWQQDPETNGSAEWELSETFRLFRNDPEIYYTGDVHEDVFDSVTALSKKRKLRVDRFEGILWHYGYLKPAEIVNRKHEVYAELLLKQLQKGSEDFKAHLNYAIHVHHRGDLDQAEKHYLRALELNPNCWLASNDLGVIWFKRAINREYMDKAQTYFQGALSTIRTEPLTSGERKQRIIKNLNSINSLRNATSNVSPSNAQ